MPALVASQTAVTATDGDGQLLEAGWTRGAGQAIGRADGAAGDGAAVLVAAARGRRGAGPAGLPDAGRAAAWPLEGQRQYGPMRIRPRLAGAGVLAPGRTVRLAIIRLQPRRLRTPGQVCISTAGAGTSPPAAMGGDIRNLIVSSLVSLDGIHGDPQSWIGDYFD